MTRVAWNDTPSISGPKAQATIYSASDGETYKGIPLSRDKEGFVVGPGLEGRFTKYIEAKAAIDHQLAQQATPI